MTHLEEVALAQVTHERDDLLIQLANTAAEVADLTADLERYDRQRLVGHP